MGMWDEQKEELKEKKDKKSDIIFKDLKDVDEKRGLKLGIYGDFSTGKTHFALTCPEPIFIIDTEMGASPLYHSFEGKDIKVLDVAEEDGVNSWEKVISAVDFILTQEEVGTIIIDSASDIWDWCQEYSKVKVFHLTPIDRLKQQWDWGTINKLYNGLIWKLVKKNCNLVITAREAEVYAGAGQPTNITKPKWQKNTGYQLDFVLHNDKKIDKLGNNSFISVVEKARPVGKMVGKSYSNLDFNTLKEQIDLLKGGDKK